MLSTQLNPETLNSAETGIRSTLVEREYLPEKKPIRILHGGRQAQPDHPWAGQGFPRKYFWVGFQHMVGL